MNTDKTNKLAEKIYPEIKDRENAKHAIKMIVTTEQLINAEKNYNDAKKELNTYLDEHNGNFQGSFLIQRNDKILSDLKSLIILTFGE